MPLPAHAANLPVADPVTISGFPPHEERETSLGALFGEFLRRVVPTSQAYLTAREIGESVAHHIHGELSPNATNDASRMTHLIVGSIGKRTAVAPLTTVDLLVVLPRKLVELKTLNALKAIWALIKVRVPDVRFAPENSGIIVPANGIDVRVIPAATHEGAFLVPGIVVGHQAATWAITNPIAEAATLRLADSLYSGRSRLLLACLKAWKRHNQVPISSFALELLVQDFYAGAPRPFGLGKALIDFWAWVRKRTPTTMHPAGAHTPVIVTEAYHAKAKAAYWRVTLADYHAEMDKIVDAALEWRAVLGDAFPVPGEHADAMPLFPGRK